MTSTLEPLDTERFTGAQGPAADARGVAPVLQWVKTADLRIDPAYQRPVTKAGRRQIHKIIAAFDWSFFAPLIVAPAAGGLFVIIDGQHRATAAAALGVEEVPAQLMLIDGVRQAAAFAAVNGAVTRMSPADTFRASVAARDPAAQAIQRALDLEGVAISRQVGGHLDPASTNSVRPLITIAEAARAAGADPERRVRQALAMLMGASDGAPAGLAYFHIKGAGEALQDALVAASDPVSLRMAADGFDWPETGEDWNLSHNSVAMRTLFAARLTAYLRDRLGDLPIGKAAA